MPLFGRARPNLVIPVVEYTTLEVGILYGSSLGENITAGFALNATGNVIDSESTATYNDPS